MILVFLGSSGKFLENGRYFPKTALKIAIRVFLGV